MPATQPIGYWSGLAQAAVPRQLRDAMAKIDVTQPQYRVLNRVNGGACGAESRGGRHPADAAGGRAARDRSCRRPAAPPRLAQDRRRQRLRLTDAGEAARARLRELVTELRGVVHEGISDEEYVAALKVLRRMVADVEGSKAS
ncbi:hypothetical protein GA0115249_112053 [Streptomyces sp. PpalLS-921]|nr:hypothetical protein GA0115249_112053 [Streptomyces sp. PpalLS-921]